MLHVGRQEEGSKGDVSGRLLWAAATKTCRAPPPGPLHCGRRLRHHRGWATAASGAGGTGAGLNGAVGAAPSARGGGGALTGRGHRRRGGGGGARRRAKAVELAALHGGCTRRQRRRLRQLRGDDAAAAPGVYSLWVLLNSEHVLGSPRLVHVRASRPSASECMLVALHSDVVAGGGEAAKFELLLRDEFGNELASPPGELLLKLSCTKDTSIDAIHGSLSTLEQSIDILEAPDEANAAAAARARAERRPPAATWVVRDGGVVTCVGRVAGCGAQCPRWRCGA